MADRVVLPVDAYAGNVLFLETSEEMPRAEEVHTDPPFVVPVGGRVRVDGPARRIVVTY